MNETLRLSSLARGLGRAPKSTSSCRCAPADRLGGHVVQGHVDGDRRRDGSVAPDGFARRVEIERRREVLRYVVHKGSITVDGISLTVAELDDAIVYRFFDPGDAGTN